MRSRERRATRGMAAGKDWRRAPFTPTNCLVSATLDFIHIPTWRIELGSFNLAHRTWLVQLGA
eukprot:2200811-Pleurochrysis_carterae.AAC.3